jgi:hypothetical protein
LAVANCEVANARGVSDESAKFTLEKEMPPEETSGTPESVVVLVSQVTFPWMAVTVSWTSAGRAVLPITKQALLCLSLSVGAEMVSWGILGRRRGFTGEGEREEERENGS